MKESQKAGLAGSGKALLDVATCALVAIVVAIEVLCFSGSHMFFGAFP